jgi:hypothetical protein
MPEPSLPRHSEMPPLQQQHYHRDRESLIEIQQYK